MNVVKGLSGGAWIKARHGGDIVSLKVHCV